MQTVLNISFKLLAGLGILIALFGIGIEFLPGAHPGLNLPQALLIVGSLLLSLAAFRLRRADARRRVWSKFRGSWRTALFISLITLIALEFVLGAVNRSPLYFPPAPPEEFHVDPPESWDNLWTCDEAGCRFAYDAMVDACAGRQPRPRECILNRQGFHDTEDFVAGDDFDGRMRILMLGDSYTFGMSSEVGKSYVDTIEANFPQSVVWNTGIPGAGTHQALALFQVYAPILQPQLAILNFYYGNDFSDNLLPMDIRLWLVPEDGRIFMRQYNNNRDGKTVTLDEQKAYYYRAHGLEPPANEIERAIGRTRLGSLLLRMIEVTRGEVSLASQGIKREINVSRGYLRDLREAAAAQDTALLVLLIPDPHDISPLPASSGYVLDEFERLLRHPLPMAGERYQNAVRLLEELDIPYLNPIHVLDIELDYPDDLEADFHWNSAGHQKIGAVLSDCIEAFQIRQDLSDCEEVEMPTGKSET